MLAHFCQRLFIGAQLAEVSHMPLQLHSDYELLPDALNRGWVPRDLLLETCFEINDEKAKKATFRLGKPSYNF